MDLLLFLFSIVIIQVVERDTGHALRRAKWNNAARKGVTPARIDVPDVYETALVEIGGDLVSFIVERDGTEGGADDVIAFGKGTTRLFVC